MISLLGIYRPRRTPLHRAPVWFKMLLLLGVSITSVAVSDPVTSIGITAACVLLLASTLPPLKATLKGMAAIVVIALFTTLFQIWRGDLVRALDLAGDIIAIAALALAISSSTSMGAMLDFVTMLARPLRWLVPPETIGVMVSLTLRAIPEAAQILTESRVAARARGLERDPRAILIPTASRTVGFALQLGQALHARGIAEHGRTATIDREVEQSDIRHDALHARGIAAPPVREPAEAGVTVEAHDPLEPSEPAERPPQPERHADAAPAEPHEPAATAPAEHPFAPVLGDDVSAPDVPARRPRRRGIRR